MRTSRFKKQPAWSVDLCFWRTKHLCYGFQVQQELAEVERESSATKAAPQGAMLEFLKLRAVSLSLPLLLQD